MYYVVNLCWVSGDIFGSVVWYDWDEFKLGVDVRDVVLSCVVRN